MDLGFRTRWERNTVGTGKVPGTTVIVVFIKEGSGLIR